MEAAYRSEILSMIKITHGEGLHMDLSYVLIKHMYKLWTTV